MEHNNSNSTATEQAFQSLERQYGEPLNEAQRLAIGNNLSNFFSLLNEWDLADKAQQQKENKDDLYQPIPTTEEPTHGPQNKSPAA